VVKSNIYKITRNRTESLKVMCV